MAKGKTTKTSKNQIGLDAAKSKKLSDGLNTLLANYQVFYMNIRGFHWNIKGHKFFELHIKFEELYNNIILKIDEIAERIVTLGETPYHAYTAFLKHSTIKEHTNISDGIKGMEHVVADFQVLLSLQRQLLAMSADADDEGTNSMMSDYIREQEKLVWMYNSFLND